MIDRSKLIFGFFALLATASAIGFGLMFSRLGDGCMNGSDSASCPALADVNGARYSVSAGPFLPALGAALEPYGSITSTNAWTNFADRDVFRIAEIDPAAALAYRVANPEPGAGPFGVLFAFERRTSPWPTLCKYLPVEHLAVQPECAETRGP